MKIIGMIFITVGLAMIFFIIYSFLKEKNKLISPIPEERGIKVIFITPSKNTPNL